MLTVALPIRLNHLPSLSNVYKSFCVKIRVLGKREGSHVLFGAKTSPFNYWDNFTIVSSNKACCIIKK